MSRTPIATLAGVAFVLLYVAVAVAIPDHLPRMLMASRSSVLVHRRHPLGAADPLADALGGRQALMGFTAPSEVCNIAATGPARNGGRTHRGIQPILVARFSPAPPRWPRPTPPPRAPAAPA